MILSIGDSALRQLSEASERLIYSGERRRGRGPRSKPGASSENDRYETLTSSALSDLLSRELFGAPAAPG